MVRGETNQLAVAVLRTTNENKKGRKEERKKKKKKMKGTVNVSRLYHVYMIAQAQYTGLLHSLAKM